MFHPVESNLNWDHLQERRFFSKVSSSYLSLMAALDSGWKINSVGLIPALQRGEPGEFCFVLSQLDGNETRILKLSQCSELARFIANEQILVGNEISYALL